MGNEGFNLLARRFAKSFSATEIDGIGSHELGIEFVLTDELAEMISNAGAVSVAAMAVAAVHRLGRKFSNRTVSRLPLRLKAADLLNGADANAIRLAQCAIHCASFRDPHFGAAYEWRNIGRIRIAIANESATSGRFVNRRLKCPATRVRITILLNCANIYAEAPMSFGDPQ
jgi:hypothetical protein